MKRQTKGPFLNSDELRHAAKEMRAVTLTSIFAAGSGHPGGSFSIMDLAATLYLRELVHDPKNPDWPERDRVFWSAGHKAPALYASLGRAGYFPLDDMCLLRQLGSRFEGHPNRLKVPGVEISSGSLGQGLGVAVGAALAARLHGSDHRVYCIMGDGEQQEGSIWEAVMAASHYRLDNLCAIVDKNLLQIDGWVSEVMTVDPLIQKYHAFNWNVLEINGHDVPAIIEAYEHAERAKGRPTVIIAHTIKGKGVSFMENQAGWHGIAPNKEQFEKAIPELLNPHCDRARVDRLIARAQAYSVKIGRESRAAIPEFIHDYWWNAGETMKVDMDPTRMGFGRGLQQAGEDPRVCTVHADISGSIRIVGFEEKNPERKKRVFSVGIAEQNMMEVAAGLAKEGFIPVTGTYGVFASGRCWDQIRTTICYNNLPVKIAGAHGGVSVGADGATHQSLEEINLMAILPNMHLEVPCDAVETERATLHNLLHVAGPSYIRYAREATPVVTTPQTPYVFGKANVIRFRGERPRFIDAFEQMLASSYHDEKEDASIIACGPMIPEAMRAAWLLKVECGIEVRVVNVHTLKPLDVEAIARAAVETRLVVTAEEHQLGGFGNLISGAILRNREQFAAPLLLDMVGVDDRFGVSGKPWELVQSFGLTAEHIDRKVMGLLERKVEMLRQVA